MYLAKEWQTAKGIQNKVGARRELLRKNIKTNYYAFVERQKNTKIGAVISVFINKS
jgi:hypothetical protein